MQTELKQNIPYICKKTPGNTNSIAMGVDRGGGGVGVEVP